MAVTQKTPAAAPILTEAKPVANLTREQIELEQLVERYLQGTLAPRQKMDLEGFCRDNPKYIDEIKLSARMHAGLKLIESAGRPEPWNEQRTWFWQTHWFAGAAVAALLALGIAAWQFQSRNVFFSQRAMEADRKLVEMPLRPAATSRKVRMVPAEQSAQQPQNILATLGGGERAEFATLEFDFSRSKFSHFNVELERVGQGRVAIIQALRRDSNGLVKWSLNSSAIGPGVYLAKFAGLDWRGYAWPAGVAIFEIEARRL